MMKKSLLIVGLGMLMVISTVQAESDGMGYGSDTTKGMSQGMAVEAASVMISAPADGAMLAANRPIMVSYKAVPGPTGNHVHLYVDGERMAVLTQLAGDYELKALSPGKHKISVEIVTKDHKHIGVGSEVSVEIR